jgi:Fe-S-cluster-containing dehydrogenase component
MEIKRRDFLKGIAGGAALAIAQPALALAREKSRIPDAAGILYDATLCIGCKACMVGCRKANNLPPEMVGSQNLWDNPIDLSARTLNIIKKYENGTGEYKDRETNGFSFIKRHCMHCVDPACVSACPASALIKDPKTGIVTYNKDACIGCRYCQVACPFLIPKFEWDNPFPKIVKCQLCNHLLAKGRLPGCCDVCPTGASLFGPASALLEDAKRRQKMQPGEYYDFPIASIASGKTQYQKAAQYIPKIYGENEVGGTQVLMLAGVPFTKLGLPDLPERSYVALAENIQHTLYKGMILPIVAFGGLIFLVKRSGKNKE